MLNFYRSTGFGLDPVLDLIRETQLDEDLQRIARPYYRKTGN